MRRGFVILVSLLLSTVLMAQEKMYIHNSSKITEGALLSATDSIYFNSEGSLGYFVINLTHYTYLTALIDSITFGADTAEITVNYNGNTATVINPLAFEGVKVKTNGANVTVYSTTELRDINYRLSGSTTNGSFKIYSEKRFNLIFNGVEMTNPYGPAINIQSNIKAFVNITEGTSNILSDGSTYDDPPVNSDGEEEDQKAVFFSEGKLEFDGTGSLTINGITADKHALCSDDEIDINNGTVTIASAAKDGIHAKNGFRATGGTIHISASGDAIDGDEGYIKITGGDITTNNMAADACAMVCDSFLVVSGGNININATGNQSKGMKVKQGISLVGGTIVINTSGAAVLSASGTGNEVSYCTAIKCDSTITIDGSNITIKATGAAGKGISSDIDLVVLSGVISVTCTGNGATYTNESGTKDAYASNCIKANRNINISNGRVTLTNSGAAGQGISVDGALTIGSAEYIPELSITSSGSKITISSSGQGPNASVVAVEAKAISANGAVTINQGTITISSADDGIKSTTSVTIGDANVNITKAVEGIESPIIAVNGGTVSIVASDDGFNATNGNGGENNDGSLLSLNGGNISVNASGGDGLDSNGSMAIAGGTIVVHGPQSQPEVGMDYNGTCNVSGGVCVISAVNSNMTQAFSTSSSQYGLRLTSSQTISAGTLLHIQDATGNNVLTFKSVRNFTSLVFTTPDLANGATYYIYTGGTSTGTNNNGIYSGGTYSGGTQKKSFTISSKITTVSF